MLRNQNITLSVLMVGLLLGGIEISLSVKDRSGLGPS
jgi:hypothetical protein